MFRKLRDAYNRSKLLRWVLGAIGFVVATAVVNGLWEDALRPLWTAIRNGLLTGIARLSHGYVERLHSQIGDARHDLVARAVLLIAFAWALLYSTYPVFRRLEEAKRLRRALVPPAGNLEERLKNLEEEARETERRASRLAKAAARILLPLIALNAILFVMIVLTDSYTRSACIWVERTIEILAPRVKPEQTLQLRAEYRGVDNAAQFYALEAHLKALAKETKTEIPSFESIR